MRWGWALVGGLLGAGVVVGILAYRQGRRFEERGALLATALEARADDLGLYLASKGEGLRAELALEADALARQEALAEGERVLALEYGWGPHLFESVARLERRLP